MQINRHYLVETNLFFCLIDVLFFFHLGPKLLTAFTALSFARDEIVWLLRHSENFPAKFQKETNKKAAGTTRDDYSDRTFPEFLFYIGTKHSHLFLLILSPFSFQRNFVI